MRRLLAGLSRRPWLWSGVLFVLVAVGGAPQAYAWYHLRAGRSALDHYRPADARRHLDACLRVWPNSSTAHLLAARAARRTGAYDEAQRHLDACSKADGKKSGDVVLEWALLGAAQGDLAEVEEFLQTRARKDPAAAPLIWEALAEGNARLYRVLTALSIFEDWLAAEPDNPRAYRLRGNLYRRIGARKAVDDYRRAIELDPEDDEARWWLAVVLQDAGQFPEALEQLEHLRARGWPDPDLRVRIARSLDRVGRTPEARDLLDLVLADNPDHGPALRVRGQIEFLAGDLPEAEKWLRAAARALPADYQTRHTLVQCLRQQQKDDAAKAEEKVAEKLKDRAERFANLRSREMSMNPHDPALHCEMGVLLDALGHTEVAEKWLYSALREDPDYRPAHAALADFYERHGRDPEKAAEHRAQARGAQAPDPDARPTSPENKPPK